MRQTIIVPMLVALSLLAGCDRHPAEQAEGGAPASGSTATGAAVPAIAAQPSSAAAPTTVTWGPKKTIQGRAVNPQGNDISGLWFSLNGVKAGYGAVLTFDGKKVKEIHVRPAGDLVTAAIPIDYISTPGLKHIVLKPSANGPELAVGEFEVTAAQ